MKSKSGLICFVLFLTILQIQTTFNKKIGMKINLKEFENMRNLPLTFNPNKITKYFMNQKPLNKSELNSSDYLFTDNFFPPNSNSIEGKDSNGNFIDPNLKLEKAINLMAKDPKTGKRPEFKRASEIFQTTNFKIINGVGRTDVIQNDIGDCYFLSALAAVSEYPVLITNLFRLNTTYKNIGYYEVVLFIDGEWQVVILDDWFVVYGGRTPITPKFAQPNGEELWAMLLEKAWAKVNRGWANIVTGKIEDAYYALLGSKSNIMYTANYNNTEAIHQIVYKNLQKKWIVSVNSRKGNKTEELFSNGIVAGHAYTIINVVSFPSTDRKKIIKLFKLRNPWAMHEWKGDWSDDSPLWTDEYKKAAKLISSVDNGYFYMDIKDFIKQFETVVQCPSNLNNAVKYYKITGQERYTPTVFNIFLGKDDMELRINIITRNWRYNRANGTNPDVVNQMVLGKYDEKGNIQFVNSVCSGDDFVAYVPILKKGTYVLWVYNSYFTLSDSQSYHYIVRTVSDPLDFKFQKVGVDKDGVIIRKLLNGGFLQQSQLQDNVVKDEVTNGSYYLGSENKSTCFAIFKYTLPISNSKKKNNSPIFIDINTTLFSNIRSLPPYNQPNVPKIFSIKVDPGTSVIFTGIKVSTMTDAETYFGDGLNYGKTNKNELIKTKIVSVEKLDSTSLCLKSNQIETFVPDYITPNF